MHFNVIRCSGLQDNLDSWAQGTMSADASVNLETGPWVRVADDSNSDSMAYFWNAETAEARWSLPKTGELCTVWHARRAGDDCSFYYWNEDTLEISDAPPGPVIMVTARLATTGQALTTVQVQPLLTVSYLGWKISSSISPEPLRRLQLMLGARLLGEDQTLKEVGLNDGATVDAVWDSSPLPVPGYQWIHTGAAVDALQHGYWRPGLVVQVLAAPGSEGDDESDWGDDLWPEEFMQIQVKWSDGKEPASTFSPEQLRPRLTCPAKPLGRPAGLQQ